MIPDIIYVQTQGEWRLHNWSNEKILDTDRIYFSEDAVKNAVIDMLNFANIDNFDKAIEYLMNRLKGETK